MKKDTKFANKFHGGGIKRVQKCFAIRKGKSSMGTKYKKDDVIVHLSSARATGEVFTLTQKDLDKIIAAKPSRYRSRTRWFEQLHRAWVKSPFGQIWLTRMGWDKCNCPTCN